MQIGMRLEIHFHQQDMASVIIESSTLAEEEPAGELMLHALFAARMLANLGRSPAGSGLAQILYSMEPEMVQAVTDREGPGAPRLVIYQGSKGRKGFTASLNASDDNLKFKANAWGMGLMARGAGYYSPNAAVLLLRHLAGRRREDDDYLAGLAEASQTIGAAMLNEDLNVRSQAHIAMTAWAMGAAKLPDFDPD